MSAWSDWLPDIMPVVPECPIPVIEHELRRAAQTFFRKTRAWPAFLPAIAIAADQDVVDLDTGDDQAAIVSIEEAWYDGRALEIVALAEAVKRWGGEWQDATGAPTAIVQMTPMQVRLYPVPTEAATAGLSLRIAARPSDVAAGVRDDLAERYLDDIAAGAKSRLMLYPGKPWTNPDMAAINKSMFDQAMDTTITKLAKAGGQGRIASRPTWC